MHYKDPLGSIARRGYCILILDFYLVLYFNKRIEWAFGAVRVIWTAQFYPAVSCFMRSPSLKLFIKGKENRKTIMRASIIYTLYYWFMCMYWLKYIRLNRIDRLKNMHGTTLEVAMLANVNGAKVRFWEFNNVWLGPSEMSLCHSLWCACTWLWLVNKTSMPKNTLKDLVIMINTIYM